MPACGSVRDCSTWNTCRPCEGHPILAVPNALWATARPCQLWKIARITSSKRSKGANARAEMTLAGWRFDHFESLTDDPRPLESHGDSRPVEPIDSALARFDHENFAFGAQRGDHETGKARPGAKVHPRKRGCSTWNLRQKLGAVRDMPEPDLVETCGRDEILPRILFSSIATSNSSRSTAAASHSGNSASHARASCCSVVIKQPSRRA
jgi:hypothetical protein